MSFIQGKKNIYAIISNEVIKHYINPQSINKSFDTQSVDVLKDTSPPPTLDVTIPKNLISHVSLDIKNNSNQCLICLNNNKVTTTGYITPQDYKSNLNKINTLRNGICKGVCTNDIQNINLSTNLLFSTSASINGIDGETVSHITSAVNDRLSSLEKNTTSNTSHNYLWLLLGLVDPVNGLAAGITGSVLSGSTTNTINENINTSVYNISQVYSNTINQLISSAQTLTIIGSGVKVKNISLSSLQDITMNASQTNCSDSGNYSDAQCINNSISDITNTLLTNAFNNIANVSTSLLGYAYQQNKTLIFVILGFLALSLFIFVFLLIKRTLKK